MSFYDKAILTLLSLAFVTVVFVAFLARNSETKL
jgi:hypothetical protein